MKDWQERVVVEKNELDEKLGKLRAFMKTDDFRSLGCDDQDLLKYQADYMSSYSFTLKRRIDKFKD